MFNITSKLLLALIFILGTHSIQAQKQLIREKNKENTSEKKWKIEWGLIGGLGVYNALESKGMDYIEFIETDGDGVQIERNSYSIMYAPRPEAEIGFFGEIGKVNSIFSFQARLSYIMRAIPKPVFSSTQTGTTTEYTSTYLNGVTVGGIFFFKPINKFKIGVGIEVSNFLITDQIANSEHAAYSQTHSGSVALRMVLSYNINPRIDMNVYGLYGENIGLGNNMGGVGCTMAEATNPNFVSAGVMMTYRLCGKEIHVKKQIKENKKVYKIDYTKS